MDQGWTVVQRGRRPRTRQPQGERRVLGRSRWMDSASSLSAERGNPFPNPSRPVPPPRPSLNTGPRVRSYADVVRFGNFRRDRRWFPQRNAGPKVTYQPASPQFGKLIRKLHGVIKMVHHLQNVALKPGKQEPRMISRMVEVLTGMIKPASPTQRTLDLIAGNAKNWGYTTYQILMEHYESGLDDLLEELSALLTPDWKKAFEVAVRWAKKNFKNISQHEIDHSEALITTRFEDEGSNQIPAPQQPAAIDVRRVSRQPVAASVATMTEPAEQALEEQPRSLARDPIQDQRSSRRVRVQVLPIVEEDSIQEDLHQDEELEEDLHQDEELRSPILHSTHSELEALFDELQAEEDREENERQTSPTLRQVRAQVHQECEEDDEVFEESFDHFSGPGPQRFRVHRHPNTQRKLTDWNLEVEKKVLMIGDSNLSIFPDFFNKNLQVESFPGSHFRHAQALMEKTLPPEDLVVEKVVLSFGINGRENKSKETTIKNVQGALRSTKRKFPYAEIWIPLVNFSKDLPLDQQENLKRLNEHIEKNMPHIPLLPSEKFQTEIDDVHWTVDTASAIFDHWMTFLNSRTP